jgi:hypothetical protein
MRIPAILARHGLELHARLGMARSESIYPDAAALKIHDPAMGKGWRAVVQDSIERKRNDVAGYRAGVGRWAYCESLTRENDIGAGVLSRVRKRRSRGQMCLNKGGE